MEKPRIGVLGGFRGKDLMNYCLESDNAELVAVCDKNPDVLQSVKETLDKHGLKTVLYDDFEDFIKHPMDGVVLANYATEHVPFAIRCLNAGLHVMSEVLPALNLKEAVELCETVEKSGKIYSYAENYCFLDVSREMKKLCQKGLLGEVEYCEGEYFHNCEPIWPSLTYGERDHWRNTKHAFYYCTHSLGPIIHATGLRPVTVTGFEPPYNAKMKRIGALSAPFAIEMVRLENGAIVRSAHGQVSKNSIRYSIIGSMGKIESALESEKIYENKPLGKIYVSLDAEEGVSCDTIDSYVPKNKFGKEEKNMHALADFYVMDNFVEAIKGNESDIIGVYEAMDMYLPGFFAYKSVLEGGIPQQIPNLRNKEDRDKWRNDVTCTIKSVAKDQWIPSYSKGNPDLPDEVYENVKKRWQDQCKK